MSSVKLTTKGKKGAAVMEHFIAEIRNKFQTLYNAEVNALICHYGITEEFAQQTAYMALCELRADLLGAQLRKGQRHE